MVFGFNTDIRVGETVFHVQTEDRGKKNPALDTTVYLKGRVVARRSTDYRDFLASPDFSDSELHAMLEQQHKEMIETVRQGQVEGLEQFQTQSSQEGISVQLLNPATFLKGTTAHVQIAVTKTLGGEPVSDASVRLRLHLGGDEPLEFVGTSDATGKADVQFPMPRLGPGGAELRIEASSAEHRDEIKYSLRPKPKPEQ